MSEEGQTANACPGCGCDLPPDGLCPGCLLRAALLRGDLRDDEDFPGSRSAGCGDYLLGELLGRGGHGVVFRARHRVSGETFAVKMLAAGGLAAPGELRRFRLEAESVRLLEHPNIVRVVEVGESEGCPFFVMRHAEGGSLSRRLAAGAGAIPVREAITLMVRVARAVQFAHDRGVLHRDLKPDNILLDGGGEPLVSDFGLVRLLGETEGLTLTGTALGTPSYMSPEQAGGRTVTVASDQFSLGAILYHMLVGAPPFRGATPMETLRKVVSEDAPDPRPLAPGVDRDLSRICLKALRREPGARYPSAAAFADDLERWLRGEPVMARPLPLPGRVVRWCRRHPIAAAVGATAALALTALVSMYLAGSWMLREERNHALAQERIAKENERDAKLARDRSRLNAYAADMFLGFRAFEDGHLGLAREMLAGHEPGEGERDLRGFEWHLLAKLCEGDDRRSFADHTAAVTAVVFSPDGKFTASGGRDGKVVVRSFPDGAEALTLPRADAPAKGIDEIPLMTKVAAASGEATALMLSGKLNPDELRMRGRPSKLGETVAVAWHPDGGELLTASESCYVRIWEMPAGELAGLIPVYLCDDAGYSADGEFIWVFAKEIGKQYSWELRVYRRKGLALAWALGGLRGAAAFAGETFALMPHGGTKVELRKITDGSLAAAWDAGFPLLRMAAADGVIYGREFGGRRIFAWEAAGGKPLGEVSGQGEGLFRVAPDGKWIASAGGGQVIHMHGLPGDGIESPRRLRGHEDLIHSLAFSPDGKWLISGGNDGSARLWAVSPDGGQGGAETVEGFAPVGAGWRGNGKKREPLRWFEADGTAGREIPGPPEDYLRTVSSADGGVAGVVIWPQSAIFSDTAKGGWKKPIRLCVGTVGPVVVSPDNLLVASGGDDNKVTVRRIADGMILAELTGHQGQLLDIAFSPDMRTLASCSPDGGLRLWHIPTWRSLGIVHREAKFKELEFSADGATLRAVRADGSTVDFRKK